MRNNFWEEQMMTSNISDFHEVVMSEMEIPEWMNINCPFCDKELPLRSIRSVSIKFNTRNLGDIAVEVLCDECGQMDNVYFRKEIEKLPDFIAFIKGEQKPKSLPILEKEMYTMQYNNVMEKMVERQRQRQSGG
ncbi:hypothetical protein D4R86_01130 [bacterium]|nr:MAG: hypothetical protein D4R86_01130 [bacterium]